MSGVIVFVSVCLLIASGAGWGCWELGMFLAGKRDHRKCSACGRTYHKSWGSICPDCSGAD